MSTPERDRQFAEILEREFRKATNVEGDISVVFGEDETITISTLCSEYVMEIGSDDDDFCFENQDSDEVVRFPIPPDWLEIE